jgi:hypothetical protein
MTEEPKPSFEIQVRAEANGYLGQAKGLRVVDQETSTAAQVLVSKLKDIVKSWRAYWKPHRDRAAATLQGLRDSEASLVDTIQPHITRLSGEVVSWTEAERHKAFEAEEKRKKAEWEARRAEEAQQKTLATAIDFEDVPAPVVVPLPPVAVKPKVDEGQLRDHWTWEVEEFEKIPHKFLKTDDGEITRYVTEFKDKAEIPGIRVFNKPILAQKRRTS